MIDPSVSIGLTDTDSLLTDIMMNVLWSRQKRPQHQEKCQEDIRERLPVGNDC